MGLFWLLRLFGGRGRPQPRRETTEPVQPVILRTRVEQRAVVVDLPQPLPVKTILRGRCWVIDGDTIVINNVRLRVAGIDAPELDHPWGRQSKWALVQMCKGQTVTAKIKPELSYDRMVAECFLPDWRDLAAELVRVGLALDWPKFSGGKYRHLEPEDARQRASTPRRMQRLNQLEVRDVAKKIQHPLSVPRSRVGLCANFRGHAAWAQHIFYCYRKRIGRSYRGKAVRCSGSLSLLCIKGTTDGGNANTIGCPPGFSR